MIANQSYVGKEKLMLFLYWSAGVFYFGVSQGQFVNEF
jgi:hypothetical protein